MTSKTTDALFRPFQDGSLTLANRIVMAPMTRCFCPNGVPGPNVADYYRRRAEGQAGLIITEGAFVPHGASSNGEAAPNFFGSDALAGWKDVVDGVHRAGGRIVPQLWHVGLVRKAKVKGLFEGDNESFGEMASPSGILGDEQIAPPLDERGIEDVIASFAAAARDAKALGFDGVEIHGAHGYIIDQFLWSHTNRRTDGWGGASLAERGRFAVELVRAVRHAVGSQFPIIFRFSQWKQQDYEARIAANSAELASLLELLADAGVDIFHASTRRFWTPEFEGSDLNLAGWAKKITGKPSITVGSIGLDQEMYDSLLDPDVENSVFDLGRIEQLAQRLDRGEFDLVAVGRALLVDPEWPRKLKAGAFEDFLPFTRQALQELV